MASLTSTLSIAAQSLMAQDAEISVTNNNIANANTVGYTRETAIIVEADPINENGQTLGDGVSFNGVQSLRDELLTNQIQQQTSQQSSSNAQVNGLNDVQTFFPTTGANLSTALSSFFTSLSALSTSPTSPAARQTVISNASNLVNQFNSVSAGLTSTQSGLDANVSADVNSINSLSQQAARLNQQILQQPNGAQGESTLKDQLSQVELSLAGMTNISVMHTSEGDTITTGSGTPLVVGGQSFALTTSVGSNGLQQVFDSNKNNITSSISSGDLGGTIQVRDTAIPSMLNQLDTMASQFGQAFNAAQASGYDLKGNPGGDLFNVPSTVAGSAAGISLATTDASAIAVSSDGTPGSDGNLGNLEAVQTNKLASGSSVTTMTSNLIYQVGESASTASSEQAAIGQSLSSLTTQQASVSGVSIDEESANLLRYQQAYQASAQVISTVDKLMTATMNMVS